MSLFDSIFGIVGGPVALGVEQARGGKHAADARGGFIAAQGGLGATAIEAAAGDDPEAVKTGVTAATALGGAAATVATLGAAAPAAAAGTAAVAGAETGAAEAGAGAAAGVAADTAATSGAEAAGAAAGAGLTATPSVAGAGTTAAEAAGTTAAGAATPTAASAAPDMISGVTPTVATSANDAPTIATSQAGGFSPEAETAQHIKDAMKVGGNVYSNVQKAEEQAQQPPPVLKPSIAYKPKNVSGELETPSISGNNQFDSIFGTPSVSGTPSLINPKTEGSPLNPLTNDQLGGLMKTPQLLEPEPLVQSQPMMSDRNNKTNITNADRSIHDFLAQINGRI